jgi:hypothetical protein
MRAMENRTSLRQPTAGKLGMTMFCSAA